MSNSSMTTKPVTAPGGRKKKRQFRKGIPRPMGGVGKTIQQNRQQPKSNDSRTTQVNDQQLYASGVSTTINQVVAVAGNTFFGVGWAYICGALQRGWLANAANNDYPFAAWRYMCGVWQNFINGTVPQGTTLPYWMWALGRAISSKHVPKGFGRIYYKGLASQGAVPVDASYELGPIAYGYKGNFYITTTTDTDLFPNALPPPIPSTDAQAFLSLCGFMVTPDRPATIMHDSNVKTIFDNDVSAFCTVIDVTGYGNQVNGGVGFLSTLEVPIHTPMLSTVITQPSNGITGSPTRFANRSTEFSGDQLFASNAMSNLMPISHWKTKKAPKLKFIDFLEIQEVVALWISKAVTQYFQDPSLEIAVSVGADQKTDGSVCPITLQEMGLLLRNEIMFCFGATQNGVQSVLPILPTSVSDNQFMPFLTGSTGCATQSYGMKLPIPLIENIRGLIVHLVHGRKSKDVELLYPVIGKYYSDELVSSDYQFKATDQNQNPVFVNTFTAVPPTVRRRKNSKTGQDTWEKTTVEVPIDFVDTSAGANYVFINDSKRLTDLAALWNTYVSTYAAYSSPLGVLSADPGINVLAAVNQTRYWAPPTQNYKIREAEVRDIRVEQNKALSSTLYHNRQVYSISYRERPFQVTSSITTNWILPIIQLQVGNGSVNAATFVKFQSLYGEECSTTISQTGDSGMTMGALHDNYAASMVHAKGTESMLDAQIKDITNKGHAGILSSLVANFLGDTFGSTVGKIATNVANVLPI